MLTPGFVALQFARPELVPYLWWVSCYFALACGVIAHNHNHCPTFSDKRANNLFGNWISVWYGYPTFAWIPTHNLNHHKLVNRAGDATITWRYTNKHNVLVAVTYFFVSSYFQSDPIKAFIAKAKAKNPSLYRRIIGQYVFWAGSHVALPASPTMAPPPSPTIGPVPPSTSGAAAPSTSGATEPSTRLTRASVSPPRGGAAAHDVIT